jgi:hypothetical protein
MMSVGLQGSSQVVDNALTNISVQMRNMMGSITNLNTWINGQGNGLAALEELGYSSAANPDNPGGVSDAQFALNMIAYLNTIAGVYNGTATQATTFNFNNELSQLWGGQ